MKHSTDSQEQVSIPASVLTHLRVLGPYGAYTYLALRRLSPGTDTWFECSLAEIVALSCLSRGVVRKALGVLEDIGLLTVKRGSNQHDASTYLLVDNSPVEAHAAQTASTLGGSPDDPPTDEEVTYPQAKQPDSDPVDNVKPLVDEVVGHETTQQPSTIYRSFSMESLEEEGQELIVAAKPKSKAGKSKQSDEDAEAVYEAWQTAGVVRHKGFTAERRSKAKAAIRVMAQGGYDDPVGEITSAIANYAAVLECPDCFFTYHWTFEEFMKRGVSQFLDECDPLTRFKTARKPVTASGARTFDAARGDAAYADL